MAAIEFRGVSRTFPAGRPALEGVDLAVADGERLAVLGPSGSGKSTLLRLAAGLDRPTAGGVWFDGRCMDDVPPHRRDVGLVFQEPTLLPYLTVAGNLEFGMKARGVARDERRRRVAEVAAMLRLDGLLGRRPSELSGGERQRAAIGRSVARRPAVLLLDEPFSSLDLPLRSALRRDLIDLHDRLGMTLIHVTHDQGEALAIGHRVAVLDLGRLVQVGPPREVYNRPATPFVAGFVGDPPMNLIPTDGRLMGIRPEHVRVRPAGETALAATVARVEDRGDSTLITLDLAGARVTARVADPTGLREGGAVALDLDPARACWFDERPTERKASTKLP